MTVMCATEMAFCSKLDLLISARISLPFQMQTRRGSGSLKKERSKKLYILIDSDVAWRKKGEEAEQLVVKAGRQVKAAGL